MDYYQVDVFSDQVLAGNGLSVVFANRSLEAELMLKITQEFKQFETIFIFPPINGQYPVRIFTVQEELYFAGHPIIGAAGLLHKLSAPDRMQLGIEILLGERTIKLDSENCGAFFKVTMNQGQAEHISTLPEAQKREIAPWFSLVQTEISPDYPLSVVSTGLPYLLVPLRNSLPKVKIVVPDLEKRLTGFGAKFCYFFDPETLECRTWDNTGIYEDVATGSAAGPLIAYLVANGIRNRNQEVILRQGRFLQRESLIAGHLTEDNEVLITGSVSLFSQGTIFI